MAGVGFMLIPFLLLGISVNHYMKSHSEAFGDVVEETFQEKDPVMNLQFQIYEGIIPIHRYVIFGNYLENEHFIRHSKEIENSFNQVLRLPFKIESEREALNLAYLKWQHIRALGNQILSVGNPVGSGEVIRKMQEFEKHFSQLVHQLRSFHDLANQEIHNEISFARNTQQRSRFITVVASIAAVFTALVVGLFMSKSILLPIRELYQGVREFAKGNVTFRLSTLCKDEIGDLMRDFNSMADTIEQSQIDLKKEAALDGLTGIFNRKGFIDLLYQEIERSRRYNHFLSLLMIDLDFFKEVNDTYGHPAGDSVLKAASDIIQKQLRKMDTIGRYGGDEFIVLLPETNIEQAYKLAKRIHRSVSDSTIRLDPEASIDFTISVGLSSFPHDADSSEALISLADQALYAAKKKGRNRVFYPHTE